jgi:DNA-binding response OmpR family regulator
VNASILIVEDDPALRQMLTWELGDLGYRVSAAKDCGEALDLASRGSFEVALLDFRLPDGTGLELLAALRSRCPALPVIMISALAGAEVRAQALRLGAVRFLSKPASVQVLDRVFQEVLGHGAG